MTEPDPRERFAAHADAYARGRPRYPDALVDVLRRHGVGPGTRVVDLGAGTGQSTELLLATGAEVFAVEPNAAMRARLAPRPGLHVIDGAAEATTLPDTSIDHAVSMQAFHWFDVEATRRELRRVLRPGGVVALIWNRRADTTPFLRELEKVFRRFAPDYDRHGHVGPVRDAKIAAFFPYGHDHVALAHRQTLDLRAYFGSVSYLPRDSAELDAAIQRLVDRHGETADFDLVTDVYVARCPMPGDDLIDAVARVDVAGVSALLSAGADPDHTVPGDGHQPTSPLRMVVFRASDALLDDDGLRRLAEIGRLLIDHGADPAPAMQLAELRYGPYDPAAAASPFMDIWHVVARTRL